jgi:hypothetical protein
MYTKHILWRLQIQIAHFFQSFLAKRNLVFTYQLSYLRKNQIYVPRQSLPLSDICIVMQGPILYRGNLTLKICENILLNYPQVPIILSTWDANPKYLDKFKNLGIVVKICQLPEYPGIGNINLQIISTREGVNLAQQLGNKFILKMRTDTWFSHPDFISLLCEEYLLFGGDDIQGPIIVTCFNTSASIPFSVNDQINFGLSSQMKKFWSAPLDSRTVSDLPYSPKSRNPEEVARNRLAEVWLVTHFLEEQEIDYSYDENSYKKVLADFFVVVDESTMGFIWFKSVLYDSRYMRQSRMKEQNLRCLTRSQWLEIFRTQQNST